MPEQQPIDIISDTMALTSLNNTKNIILMAAEMVGGFDEAAFKAAVKEACERFPELTSVLSQTRNGRRFYLSREYRPALEIPVFMSEIPDWNGFQAGLNLLMFHLAPRLDRNWDLWKEPPIEIHVLRAANEHFVMAFLIHHVVADAAMALRIITEILVRYHKIVKGETPTCLSIPHVFSTSRKRREPVTRKFGWKDFWSQLRRDLANRKQKPQQPHGTGNKKDPSEWHVKRVLSLEGTDRVMGSFAQNDARFVDHLIACANMSLDKWNADRNISPGLITTAVTVNMRERFGGTSEKNYSSVIFFRSNPGDRESHTTFVRQLAQARHRQLSRRVDLTVRKSISRAARFLAVFPLWIRRRIAHKFMQHQRYSFSIGFLGVVWPEFKEGTLGEDSCLVKLGDANIIDVHGTGYKIAGNASVNVYAYIYRRRLHLVLTSSAALLTRQECEDFMEVLVRSIFDAAHLSRDSVGESQSVAGRRFLVHPVAVKNSMDEQGLFFK
ncbi:MAG: hypothetical protein HY913_23610 [Desulfomonile tiedjei]|nr:hypothetical protein [Desulfomonile tiedjei]